MAKIGKIIAKLITLKPKWFWRGFAVGIIYFGYVSLWVWDAYPLVFASSTISGPLAILLIFFPFIITVTGMALFWGCFAWLLQKIINNKQIFFIPFLAGGFFTIIEFLRSYFFGILWWGSGSLFGPHWPFNNPAYLFSNVSPVFKTLSIWGIYGLDFWIIFTVTALILFLLLKKKIFLIELAIAISIIAIFNIIYKQGDSKTTPTIPVSIIQTEYLTKSSYATEEELDHFRQGLVLFKEAAKNMADKKGIIVFAEGSNFSKNLSFFLDPFSVKTFFNSLSKENILIVDSNQLSENNKSKLTTVFVDSKKGVVGSYDKQLLMPGTEFMPYLIKWPLVTLRLSAQQTWTDYKEFSKGISSNVLRYNNLWVKILICSDALSPELARKGNFDFIIVQNGFGVMGGSRQLANQMLAVTKARAIENSRDLIFASNYGRSYIINASGNILKIADNTGYKILTGDIAPRTDRTWYNKLGDWPILILSLTVALFGFCLKFFGRSLKKNANQV